MKKAKKIQAIQKEYKDNIKRRNKLMRELEKKNAKAAKKENLRQLFERLKAHKNDLECVEQDQSGEKVIKTRNELLTDMITAILELSKETNLIKK